MKSSKFTLTNDRFEALGKTIVKGRWDTNPYVKKIVKGKNIESVERDLMRERGFFTKRYVWDKLLKSKKD